LVQPHKSILIQALIGAVVYTVLGLSTSIYIQKITDYVLIDGNRRLLNLLSIAMIVILLFQIFIGYMKSVLVLQTGQKMDKQIEYIIVGQFAPVFVYKNESLESKLDSLNINGSTARIFKIEAEFKATKTYKIDIINY
jgi:ABC-type protease/lipase transport system fused ATPase/permease subunit